jgi:TPP-dependent pyruvate/acetoin dehydrogenase alpha subunit
VDLLRTYLRGEALEALLAEEAVGNGSPRFEAGLEGRVHSPRSLTPALPAAAALRFSDDGRGDLFSQRIGSPCATLALGATPDELLRQALGRVTAPAGGRDPGGFPTDLARGWVGPVSVPGVLVEVMAGVAIALRLRREPRVALVVDDTSGSASGDWHEGLNLAVVRQAPLVLVNHDVGGPLPGAGAGSMAERAEAYGFRVWEAEDMDPEAVLEVSRRAVEAARAGDGVQVVDVRAGPVDGLETLVSRQRDRGVDEAALAGLREEASAEMRAALERVAAEPAPDPGSVRSLPQSTLADPPDAVRTPRPWS